MAVIEVRPDHIAHGEATSPFACPVALAIHDAFPDEEDISVLVTFTRFYGRNVRRERVLKTERTLPKHVATKITRYDETGQMRPFKFRMAAP